MRLKNAFLVVFLTFINLVAFAQTPKIDSLRTELQQTTKDSLQVKLYYQLAQQFYFRSTDSMDIYVERGLALANDMNYHKWIAAYTHSKALLLEQNSSREAAIEQYLKAGQIYQQQQDSSNLLKVHAALTSRYNEIGDLPKALQHYELGKKYLRKGNLLGEASLNNRMGIIYGNRDELETAMRYFKLNLPLYQAANNDYGLGFTHQNIGVIYDELNQPDSAFVYLHRGITFLKKANKPQALANCLSSLGEAYLKAKKHEKALAIFLEAYDIFQAINSPAWMIPVYENLTRIYFYLKNYHPTIEWGEKGLQLAEETQDLLSQQILLDLLQQSYAAIDNYSIAHQHSQALLTLNDSLSSKENKEIIKDLETKYQSEQQQTQLDLQQAELAQQRNLLIASGIAGAFLLSIVFFVFRLANQRKKLNQQLQQLDVAKSHFFANVSHELRTPLTLIIAPLKNAIEKVKNQLVKEDLELAYKNGQQLLNLVNEILDLSKLESGKMTLETKKVQVSSLLQRIFYAYESFAQYKGIDFKLDNALPQQLWALLDIQKFEKILNNLLSNALKYSESGDQVWMQALVNDTGHLTVTVKDTGSGIATADLPKLFDRYYQSQQKKDNFQGGTGIGLALAKEYTHLFQGDLTVESQLEKGTTFYLNLPLQTTTAEVPLAAPTFTKPVLEAYTDRYQPQILAKEKPKLLIVEDHREMSQFLLKTLAPFYHCTPAYNGIEALEKLQTNRFDLITSDVMMPQMDGFTLLEKIHQRELFSHTPVILLTARSLEQDKLQGFQLGVDDYITKPFNAQELIARIDNLLKNKREREAWIAQQTNGKKETVAPLPIEQELIQKAETLVMQSLSNPTYNVEALANELNYSRRQLVRIIKKLTGLTPLNFIKEIRLQKARNILETRQFATVAEVGFEVGFSDASYFSKAFKKRFGKVPGDFRS